ncbi:MAG: InlB B-repeat-containing protein [Lachnospiraceae bacterium]|nr:InlB B-repeat-containing protein [Lachnospiraceae bacterium]
MMALLMILTSMPPVSAKADDITTALIYVDAPVADQNLATEDELTVNDDTVSGEAKVRVESWKWKLQDGTEVQKGSVADFGTVYVLEVVLTGTNGGLLNSTSQLLINNTVVPQEECVFSGNTVTINHAFPATSNRRRVNTFNVRLTEPAQVDNTTTTVGTLLGSLAIAGDQSSVVTVEQKKLYVGTTPCQDSDVIDIVNSTVYKLYVRCKVSNASKSFFDDKTVVRVNGKMARDIEPEDATQEGITIKGYYINFWYSFIPTGYHYVTFDLCGHGEEIPELGVEDRKYATIPTAPTETGWIFEGWYDSDQYEAPFVFASTPIMRDTVVYAKWSPCHYSLTYDTNGANVSPSDTRFRTADKLYGDPLQNPNEVAEYLNLTKTGYAFKKWAAVRMDDSGNELSTLSEIPATMPPGNLKLKAIFDPVNYTITYDKGTGHDDAVFYAASDANYASPLTAQQIADSYSSFTMETESFDLPVLRGADQDNFLGWYLADDTTRLDTITQGQTDYLPAAGTNLVLTAKWGINSFALTWDLSDGSPDDADYTAKDGQPVLYDTAITAPNLTRAHYTQTGWQIKVGNGQPIVINTVSLAGTGYEKMPAANITIKAIWSPVEYSLVYDLQGGSWKTWQEISDGHTPAFMKHADGTGTEGVDYFTVTTGKYPDLPQRKTEVKAESGDYHFVGWYYKEREIMTSAPDPNDYSSSEEYNKAKQIYDNKGWDPQARIDVFSLQTLNKLVSELGGTSFRIYARFDINEPILTWDFCGGTPTEYSPVAQEGEQLKLAVNTQVNLPVNVTKEGYDFVGWKFYLEGSTEPLTGAEIAAELGNGVVSNVVNMPNHALLIRADLRPIEYTVNYVIGQNKAGSFKDSVAWTGAAAGTDSYNIESSTFNLRKAADTISVTDGYEFAGWYEATDDAAIDTLSALDPDDTTDEEYETVFGSYTKGDKISKGSTGDKTYVAVWKRKSYTVVWNINDAELAADGGDDNSFTPKLDSQSGVSVYRTAARFKDDLKAPDLSGRRRGYIFKGWYTEAGTARDDGKVENTKIPMTYETKDLDMSMPASVITLYAVWEVQEYSITYKFEESIGNFEREPARTYNIEKSVHFEELTPVSLRYQFAGWYTEQPENPSDPSAVWNEDKKMTGIPLGTSGNLTLFARWNLRQEQFSIDFNGGLLTGEANYTRSGTKIYGDALTFPVLEKKGYSFDGWNITASFEGTALPEEFVSVDDIAVKYPTITKTLSCTAVFSPVVYKITYHRDSDAEGVPIGSFSSAANVLYQYTVEDPTKEYVIPPHVASDRPDMLFIGWYNGDERPKNPDPSKNESWNKYASQKVERIVPGTTTGDLNLWAVWIENEAYAKEMAYEISMIRQKIAALETLLVNGNVVLTPEFEQKLDQAYKEYASSMNQTKLRTSVPEVARLLGYYDDFHYLADQKAEQTAAAIRAIGNVTYDKLSEDRINKARDAYDDAIKVNATRNQLNKIMKDAESKVVSAEQIYTALGAKTTTDNSAAQTALKKIQAIPEPVTLTNASKEAIDTAVAYYEALSQDQKNLLPSSAVNRMNNAVSTYDNLSKTYAKNKTAVDSVTNKLSLVPEKAELTDIHKALIEDARASYDNLTSDQKSLVSADLVLRLENAEREYNRLKEEKDTAEYKKAYKKWDAGNQSQAEIEKKIKKTNTDVKNVSGAKYVNMKLRAIGGKDQIKLKWKKVKKASGYLIYGSEYGTKMKLLATVKGKKKTTWKDENAKSDTYHKYIVVAYKNVKKFDTKKVLAVSETVYAARSNGNLVNPSAVVNTQIKGSILAAPGEKYDVTSEALIKKADARALVGIRYESSNNKVATVDSKGVVTCKKPGKAVIYAIAQNGIAKSFKVLVKKEQ